MVEVAEEVDAVASASLSSERDQDFSKLRVRSRFPSCSKRNDTAVKDLRNETSKIIQVSANWFSQAKDSEKAGQGV